MLSLENLHRILAKGRYILIKTYHIVQQWDHWLTHFLGETLMKTEQQYLIKQFAERYGRYALLLGVPHQHSMLDPLAITKHVVLSPLINKNTAISYIEGSYKELPIASGSLDIVVIPHTLEFLDNPRQLLNEACRIVKPEGDIIIFGFNPYSLWGINKWWLKGHKKIPWHGHFISAKTIKNWLTLADFQLVRQDMLMFRPPLHRPSLMQKLTFLEWIGVKSKAFFGGVYVITAKAKVIPLTPIKLHWKQQISPLRVSISGPTMRDM